MGNTSSTGSPSSRNSTDRTDGGGGSSSLGSALTGAANNLSSRITGGNNNATSLHIPSISSFSPFRGTGSLGLTKAELDLACRPSGLYPSCEWDSKQIRRLIGDGRLAPRLRGSDSRCTKSDRECPICFMLYSQSNVTKCCEATICTECYLQIKTPKEKNTTCPFCNCPKMQVLLQKAMDEDAIAKREEDEQRVIESIIRNRVAQVNGEMPLRNVPTSPSSESDGSVEGGFGSSLEQYNRSRTFSNSSSAVSEASFSEASCHSPIKPRQSEISDNDALLSLAMSPDARLELEREMAAQLSHETHQRMESEAEEARIRHAEEWSRTDSGMRSRMREARIAELTSLLERMSHNNAEREELGGFISALEYGGRGVSSRGSALENLMRLEAAFLNATGEGGEGRRRPFRRGSSERIMGMRDDDADADNRYNSFSVGSPRRVVRGMPRRGVSTTHMETAEMLMRGISEEEQLAMAIAMSMQENNRQQQEQQQQQQNEQQQNEGQVTESDQGAQVAAAGLETHEEAQSDDSSSSSESDSDTDEINNMHASTPSLADGEEEVVFERESSQGDLV